MKTEREAESIQTCLDKLTDFFNTLAEETGNDYDNSITCAVYDNVTETIRVRYSSGDVRNININIDSVTASMKDAIKVLFRVFD